MRISDWSSDVCSSDLASASDTAGRGNDGSANIALRGLSAVNALVLLNGRRVLSNSASGTVDLNSFPFEAVERMEVLQDGASAVYGSDAISGVVNVIMRRDYDGLLLKGGYGVSSRGDLPNYELSGTFGQKRPEERRVGKRGVGTCRSRWS